MEIKSELKYTRKSQIGVGEGLNSTVYLVDEPQLGGQMVVKEMPKSRFGGDASIFFREAQAMFASSAPNVVPIQYASQTPAGHLPELVCICMPYFKNGSLAKRIEVNPLSLKEFIRVGQGILLGLGTIHAKKLLHFDIKPTNIFFNNNDEPLVADFGQACTFGITGTAIPAAIYQPAMPPEMIGTYTGNVQSDIYQVGLTLYRAANGEPVYQQQVPQDVPTWEQRTLRGKFPDRDLFLPHVPQSIRKVIRKALRTTPSDRYGSAAEMADAISRIQIRNDWIIASTAMEATWTSHRDQRPDLIVKQKKAGSGWNIELYTQQSGSKLRAKDIAKWKSGQSLKDSNDYLKTLFADLESA